MSAARPWKGSRLGRCPARGSRLSPPYEDERTDPGDVPKHAFFLTETPRLSSPRHARAETATLTGPRSEPACPAALTAGGPGGGPAGRPRRAYQPQEGGAQHRRDEPSQRAPGPAAPPGARRPRLLRRGLGLQEPLPGRGGRGPAGLQCQLQLGGSRSSLAGPPSAPNPGTRSRARPRPAVGSARSHTPPRGAAGARRAPSCDPPRAGRCHVAEMWLLANRGLFSGRKLAWLPRRPGSWRLGERVLGGS